MSTMNTYDQSIRTLSRRKDRRPRGLTDRELGSLIGRGLMTISEAATYSWRRDCAGRAAERAAINGRKAT